MEISLTRETQSFIDEQVKAGRFKNAQQVLEEAMSRMMMEEGVGQDEETIAAINRAEDQIDRAEGIEFDAFAARMRGMFTAKK